VTTIIDVLAGHTEIVVADVLRDGGPEPMSSKSSGI
jgi:hypothetical protein